MKPAIKEVGSDNEINFQTSPATAEDLKNTSEKFFLAASEIFNSRQVGCGIPICQNVAYTAEFLVKSCILKKYRLNTWPTDMRQYPKFNTHNLVILIDCLGLKDDVKNEMKKISPVGTAFMTLKMWKTECRYQGNKIKKM